MASEAARADEARDRLAQTADDLVDELLPESLDWRYMVQQYPLPVLFLALLAGFFLGRHRGHALLGAFGSFAAREATRNIAAALERAGVVMPANDG